MEKEISKSKTALAFANRHRPAIAARGTWIWDDVMHDWYDDGLGMYYSEIEYFDSDEFEKELGESLGESIDKNECISEDLIFDYTQKDVETLNNLIDKEEDATKKKYLTNCLHKAEFELAGKDLKNSESDGDKQISEDIDEEDKEKSDLGDWIKGCLSENSSDTFELGDFEISAEPSKDRDNTPIVEFSIIDSKNDILFDIAVGYVGAGVDVEGEATMITDDIVNAIESYSTDSQNKN